ncbi:low temperature requirement protein A [Fodinicola feengrottensis]|uniref:Low temperature requirement protein A n=1 Tax=Fodinicola feengrottensis TaxID=435914 RepID=A0ABN2IW89_9ACTN
MTAPPRPWYRPMVARRADEEHRASTPLELLFDLCFVVTVAQAAAGLHHSLSEGHVAIGVARYAAVFFAIWWAWMNFTWFASAYDTDDGIYRVTTLVQIAGGLVMAAGIARIFDHADFRVVVGGFVVMRLAMVVQWLRAASADPQRRPAARRYAAGITIAQMCWVGYQFFPAALAVPGFVFFALVELAVPIIAERASPTTWHPEHIGERYGLFTLIVLGESVAAASTAIQTGLGAGSGLVELFGLAASGLVVVFGMWWVYFDQSGKRGLDELTASMKWGYGHLAVFSAAAGLGAGLQVAVDGLRHDAHLPALTVGLAVTVPIALYLLSVWILMIGPTRRELSAQLFPVAAVLVLAGSVTPVPVTVAAVVLAALVLVRLASSR